MKIKHFLFFITLIQLIYFFGFLQKSFAQSQFQLAIGGTGGDWAYSILQTKDGGYTVAGYTNSFGAGGSDMYNVKLSSPASMDKNCRWNFI